MDSFMKESARLTPVESGQLLPTVNHTVPVRIITDFSSSEHTTEGYTAIPAFGWYEGGGGTMDMYGCPRYEP